MPRNPSTGVYSKPAGTTPSVGQVIDPAPWNALTTDLGNEITNSLPRDGSAPMVAPLKGSSGSGAAPSYTFSSEITTGFYLKSAGVVAAVSAGTEIFNWASTGLSITGNVVATGFVTGKSGYAEKTGNYTAVAADVGSTFHFTVASTLTLSSATTLGLGWPLKVIADGVDVVISPTGTDMINGANASIVLKAGQWMDIRCSGSAFFAGRFNDNGMVSLGAAIVSSPVLAVDFPNILSSAYDLYLVELDGLAGSTTSALVMQLSTDGGTNWLSTGYDYSAVVSTTTNPASTQLANQGFWGLGTSQVGTAGGGVAGVVHLHRLSAARRFEASLGYIDSSGTDFRTFNMAGRINQAADSIRIRFSSGNIASGTVRIYGVRK